MIAGFEHRWQVEAQLSAFEHERRGAQNQRHLDAIAAQEAIFKAELERMDREGDYEEPKRTGEPGNHRLGRHRRPRTDHRLMRDPEQCGARGAAARGSAGAFPLRAPA